VKKETDTAAAEVAAGSEAVSDVKGNADAETVGLAEGQQPGKEEQEQSSHDLEDSVDDEAAHEEEENHEDTAPLAHSDGTAESEIESTQSQNLIAEEHPNEGNGDVSEQPALPGEKEAENSVAETEAEAASEHEPSEHGPEATPNAALPETRLDEVKARHATVGDELENMVTMLQEHSFPASTHLDVAGEIPDEE